jgi:hypothetical protein
MAYVNKRSGKNGAKRFTGLYKAADGTYKSAGTFGAKERALEVAEAAERHERLQLAETSPADKATVPLATYMERFLSAADIEANSKETYARHLTLHVIPYIGKLRVAEVSRETIHRLLSVVLKEEGASQSTTLHARTAADMLAVRRPTVEVTAKYHPTGDRFLTRVHQERRSSPVQGRSCGLGNGAGAHRASRNRARPGDLPGAAVRLDRGRRPGPAHPRADRCPGLHW